MLDSRAAQDENVDMHFLALAFALACAASCKKAKDEAPCGTVAGRLFAVAHLELAKATVDPATRRAVADQLPAMRDALTQACSDGKWGADVRNCMANAPDHAALQTCQLKLTDDQRHKLDRASRGETSTTR